MMGLVNSVSLFVSSFTEVTQHIEFFTYLLEVAVLRGKTPEAASGRSTILAERQARPRQDKPSKPSGRVVVLVASGKPG